MESGIGKVYVQYGAGNQAVKGWVNFDASPTLRIQRLPIIGRLVKPHLNCVFEDGVIYGDIIKGLPLDDQSVDGLFCSHVLEHLSYDDFSIALSNSFKYLKKGATFRIIVPDLEYYINRYVVSLGSNDENTKAGAAIEFCQGTCLGRVQGRSTWKSRLRDAFSNSDHRWMWDYFSLVKALENHGFANIRKFQPGNSEDRMFLLPERPHQFGQTESYGLAVECEKPL